MDATEDMKVMQPVSTTTALNQRVAMSLKDVAVSFGGRVAVRDVTFDVTSNRVTSLDWSVRARARPRCCAR